MNDRVTTVLLGLIVQLGVSAVLVPWDAASATEFYSGAKLALAIGLLANVLVRLVMMRWAARTSGSQPHARTSREAAGGEIGGFWYVLIALAFALVLLIALVGMVRSGLV